MREGILVVFLLAAAGLTGCVKDTAFAPSAAPRYMTVKQSDFFKYGPVQPGPADQIPSHTILRVTTLEKDGYSTVLLANGASGYMATEDLKVAPPIAKSVSVAQLFPEDNYAKLAAANEPHVDFRAPVDVLPSGYQSKQGASGSTH